jgi:thioredoxin
MPFTQFVLLGLPGVDVQAHAIELAQRRHLPHISMGALLREAIAAASDIGQQVRPYVDAGELVPDDGVMKLIRKRLEQPDVMLHGSVIDGFPRTVEQAQAFDALLSSVQLPAPQVVYLEAMTGLLMNRLWKENTQQESTTVIRRRLEAHQALLMPIVDYYKSRSQLTTLNGSLPFAEVAGKLARLGYDEASAATVIQDEAELDALLAQESLLVVDGMASWCGPCKLVAPLIDRLANDYRDRAKVMKMDFEINHQIPQRFGLKGMPAVMFFKDGELQEILTGVQPYQMYSATVNRFLE